MQRTSERGNDDAQIMFRIAAGDAGALADLYDLYAARVLGLTTRILADPEEAQDVLQDVFLHVWRNPSSYASERGSLATWILILARSRAIDRLRSLRRRGRDRQVELGECQIPSPEDLEHDAGLRQEGRAVQRVMSELPPDQRRALELAYFGGYTQIEIASLTGAPLGTVKTRLRQGLMRLREGYRAYFDRGEPFAAH
jgi:RNA polymerase sigma-70 factor (ECF subfamily)